MWQGKFKGRSYNIKSDSKIAARICLASTAGGFGGFCLSSVQPPFWIHWRLGELGRECENIGGGGGGGGEFKINRLISEAVKFNNAPN